ncbi:MAG TPA: M20/M25/M40 family metallo-hydrolase [Fimbriimonas sp.]|nr:M20/M25/M40 family metallo-hydrolase [Fimbriimonas sp.]
MPSPLVALLALLPVPQIQSQLDTLLATGLRDLGAYSMLADLTTNIGPRLSGSPNAERAVVWAERTMKAVGLQNVRRIPCLVPHWVRGEVERANIIGGGKLAICALGGSVGTPKGGVEAEVIEVHSLQEAVELGEKGRGKIVFFNRPFDPSALSGGAQYGGAVDQRTGGASAAAKSGALAVLVRSMTAATDDEPHTGALNYIERVTYIPAAALGIQSANRLSRAIARGATRVRLELSCKNLLDVPSASVCGDIVGTEKPNEIIVLGGHLDSWDLGQGAHDDGAGVTQSIEAARLLVKLGMKPKRTIRIVAFQNEENGTRGARAFAEWSSEQKERQYAACESDAGGFMPRAFGVDPKKIDRVRAWEPLLRKFGIERFNPGGGGADIAPLAPLGATLFGLSPDGQRYFDYHHSRNDTLDKVHPRELEFGAAAMAALAWLIAQEGLD